MTENVSDVLDEDQQRVEEIHSEIRKLQEGTKSPDAFTKGSKLASELKGLIGLGAAVASQRDYEFVGTCVIECLRAGATRDEIMEVLRQAILMAEIPAETYTRIVRDAVDAFESQL